MSIISTNESAAIGVLASQAPSRQENAVRGVQADLDLLAPAVIKAPSVSTAMAKRLMPPRYVRRALDKTARAVEAMAPYALAAGAATCLFGRVGAYPCTGYDADANQYFSDVNRTILGRVHGWFSDCYDYVCGEICNTICSSGANGVQSCYPSCTPTYCTATDENPQHYVGALSALIERDCGFDLVDSIPAANLTRIANGLLEANHWATILVNTFNITNTTDPTVDCLHGLG